MGVKKREKVKSVNFVNVDCEGEDGGVHGEGGDEVRGEHQVAQGAGLGDGEEDVPRIQSDVWSLSPSRPQL